MAIFTTIVCGLLAIIALIKEKNIYNPAFIMSALWGVITFLAQLQLFNYYEASSFTYTLIMIGIISFCVGTQFSNRFSLRFGNGLKKTESMQYEINQKLFVFLCVFSALLLIVPAINGAKRVFLQGISMAYIRNNVELYNNTFLDLLCNYIAKPFNMALIPLSAIYFFTTPKRSLVVTVSTIVIVIENVLFDGGRGIIIYLICAFFITYKYFDKKIQIKKSIKVVLFVGVLAAFAGVIVVSNLRGIQGSLGESLYGYLAGCVPHLSLRLEQINEHTYGFASLFGFFEFIFTMFENLGFGYPAFYKHACELMYVENTMIISSTGTGMNAFVGPYFYMYLDLGLFGVLFGMFIYGAFTFRVYKGIKTKVSLRNLGIYLLLAQGLITSFIRIQFHDMYYVLGFVFIILIIRKKNYYDVY